ncbi:MAG: radical SAM protein [Planctomycetaceae bacterium]|nr:radical SAM protein [Planctomycetaceae bacterium]
MLFAKLQQVNSDQQQLADECGNACKPITEYNEPTKPRTWSESLTEIVHGNMEARKMFPLSYMELILTSDCNLRCSYCFERDKKPFNMSDEVAFAAVDFLIQTSRDIKDLTILLFGGEPMLRFDLIQRIVPYANKKAADAGKTIGWDMTTNGTLIDETRARWMAEHKVKYLLSLDGAKEDHDRYRKFPDGRSSYELIMEHLPMMKSYQPWMGTKMSVTPESTLRLRDNLYELWKNGINQFIVGYAHGLDWNDENLLKYEQGMLNVCELYLEMKYNEKYFRITAFEEESLCDIKEVPFGCGAGRGRFCVDTQGDLYGCSKMCTIMGHGKGILPFGNVLQGFTLINNRKHCLNDSIKSRRKCQGCDYEKSCGGGCPATNYERTGSIYLQGDEECETSLIYNRINEYMRKRHDDVFNTDWSNYVRRTRIEKSLPLH